jgi:aryl-alcohol dehydrogenase-like predicted oxidoreductase
MQPMIRGYEGKLMDATTLIAATADRSAGFPPIPRRLLGRTGCEVTQFALGGEGVLRTHGRMADAIAVIDRALDQGVTYCDTAPAYAGSLDYYGAALGERRGQVFLASKTHDRTRDGALRLLDESLARLRTDHLDLWQLHDLRSTSDLKTIFGRGGALEALIEARAAGRVRFLGLTGHHDPEILLEAMRRFDFDTVLVALNVADIHRLSFARTVLVEAVQRGMGVIGMKVYAAGALFRGQGREAFSPHEAMGYVLSLPGVSTVVIGCSSPAEVDTNAEIARAFQPYDEAEMRTLEQRTNTHAGFYTSYKRPA